MKVILYAAISADGFIADKNGSSEFTSEADEKRLTEMARKSGNVVMGRKTYEYRSKDGMFPMLGCLNVVMTTRKSLLGKGESDKILFTNETPIGVMRHLEEKGFTKILVVGGAKTFTSFMELHMVDELYLTVEPMVLGRGLKIFGDKQNQAELKLMDTYQLSSKEIQLHFKVKK